jgi:malate synthase
LIELGPNRYGKSAIRLVKVVRGADGQQIRDLTVAISLEGDFEAVHLSGDNSGVVATDTMKNTTHALAREHLTGPIEHFGRVLAEHFAAFPQVSRATVTIKEHAWTPVPTHAGPARDSFVRTDELTRTAVVAADGRAVAIDAGFDDLTLMKTAHSAFAGFPRDEFTTLAETDDRLLASKVSATWSYGSGPVDYDAAFDGVCTTLLDVFAEHHSPSVQATIWTIGQAVLRARPEIDEIRLTMPNLHHWLVDLTPFGQANDREIYTPTSEPYGLIEATVRRGEAAAGLEWAAAPGVPEPEPEPVLEPAPDVPEPEPVRELSEPEPQSVPELEPVPDPAVVAAVEAAVVTSAAPEAGLAAEPAANTAAQPEPEPVVEALPSPQPEPQPVDVPEAVVVPAPMSIPEPPAPAPEAGPAPAAPPAEAVPAVPVSLPDGVEIRGSDVAGLESILTSEALDFVARLQRQFGARRLELLAARKKRQSVLDRGIMPDFLPETADVRNGSWTVARAPADLADRRVEITGPAEPKMMINALNSGARVFMADLEDSLSPTWANVIGGQAAIADAVRRRLEYDSPEGKPYRLDERIATLVVRPRGWQLDERHLLVDGESISASLFDFGLFVFHNAREQLSRGTAPYVYLPKLESHLEARLWNDVFKMAQEALGIPVGTIRATVLIESILAAFEMDEILYELREHAAGLNAGRWDYLFSCIKKFRSQSHLVLPDRMQLTMTVPFMRAYTQLLVQTCHRRGAHAIGGMAAFIPSRKDPEVNAAAMARVGEDKERESSDGFDGTWVAHPDLVPLATKIFDGVLGAATDQKARPRPEVSVTAADLLNLTVEGGLVTEAGVRTNVSVALQYLDSWLLGNGAAAINNLMEDAATAEICRSQLWQWRATRTRLADSRVFDGELYKKIRHEELGLLGGTGVGRLGDAVTVLDQLVFANGFPDFLTVEAYRLLD